MSLPYTLQSQIGSHARFGLIVLKSDETIEAELRNVLPKGDVALFTTRIESALEVTPATLAAMEGRITASAALFPETIPFDVVAYGCTSASSVIGAARVADLVRNGCNTAHVTNPVSALVHKCRQSGVERLALISPYTEDVNEHLRATLRNEGIATPVFESFNEPVEARVARIDPLAIRDAALKVGRSDDVDAVFLSCTNLRTQSVLPGLNADLGKPVYSSNSVLFDHMVELVASTGSTKKKAEQ